MKQLSPSLFRPAIFGLADGMMSVLGSILFLLGYQHLIVPVALLGGLSAGLSMANGELMSDSEHGWADATVMGIATFLGTFAPAVPFLFATGWPAMTGLVGVCLVIGVIVGIMRGRQCDEHSMFQEVTMTILTLLVIFGITLLLSRFIHGGGGAT